MPVTYAKLTRTKVAFVCGHCGGRQYTTVREAVHKHDEGLLYHCRLCLSSSPIAWRDLGVDILTTLRMKPLRSGKL